jgi:hypothetical protein
MEMIPLPSEIERRKFLQVMSCGVLAAVNGLKAATQEAGSAMSGTGRTVMRLETSPSRAQVPFLSWDTEGGDRAQTNLLRTQSPLTIRVRLDGEWQSVESYATRHEPLGKDGTRFRVLVAPEAEALWSIEQTPDRVSFSAAATGPGASRVQAIEMLFPLDPQVTPTTVLAEGWTEGGDFRLPAVLSAPDFGQMLFGDGGGGHLRGRLVGSRKNHTVDLSVELPLPRSGEPCVVSLTPVYLPPPPGLENLALWGQARRGWFNAWQPTARWGEQDRPFSAPAGIMANNVISDPASCSLWFYADHALWMPQVAPGISVAGLVRHAVDWWLDKRTRPDGEVICYWDYGNFLDANAGILIAAWDYVEATGDLSWLSQRIERLEYISDFLSRRDVDGDGLVEAKQSGNRGTLIQPARSCCYFDAVNCGHKDGYSNAIIYRAWRCLAELEGRLGRLEPQARFSRLADRLKTAYTRTLYNSKNGWLGWWKSEDGELHDYASTTVNALAVEYGLVSPAEGRKILDRLCTKMEDAGFKRFDLGVPVVLIPIHRSDYLLPDAIGCPKREDGADSFGHYQNGGVLASCTLHFLAAHYVVDEPERADSILQKMLQRQAKGMFQNGVRDSPGKGTDLTTWDGSPCGYEGYLADNYYFLQAVLLREAKLRKRFLRPLMSS